jgi:glycosyltransferase involved in cell wall biosynthesis
MSAADIAVVPYPDLNRDLWLSPLKLYEYMASGNAIVASAVGQVANVIQDGGNGLLIPPGDATAMTAALKRLIGDPDLRAQLGTHAREYAVQKHSWEHYLGRLERLFAAVISREPVDAPKIEMN